MVVKFRVYDKQFNKMLVGDDCDGFYLSNDGRVMMRIVGCMEDVSSRYDVNLWTGFTDDLPF